MKDLQELIKLLTARSQNPLPLLGKREMKPGKENTLYEKIKSGEYTNDEQAALHLYGSTPADAKYRVLKNRLEQKLLNQLFFIDFTASGVKKSHKYEMECYDLLHQGRVLTNMGFYNLSEKVLNKALTKAKEGEFTDIILSCLDILLFIYSIYGDERAFQRTERQLLDYQTLAAYEKEAGIIYFKARMYERHSTYMKQKYMPQLEGAVARLDLLWRQTGSFTIFECYLRLNVFRQEYMGNFREVMSFLIRIELLCKENKINQNRFDHRFLHFTSVFASLMLKEYDQGLQAASTYMDSFEPSSNNWFSFMNHYFLLAVHAKKHSIAVSVLQKVTANPFITKITQAAQETWILNRTMFHFICPDIYPLTYKNYQTFIAVLPVYTKDKHGFNISVLAIQFLYHLKLNSHDELTYFAQNIKKYIAYHLKTYEKNRAIIFLRLIVLLIKYELNTDKCLIKGKDLYERLINSPISTHSQAEIEIVPFEHLWEMIIQMTKNVIVENVNQIKKPVNKSILA